MRRLLRFFFRLVGTLVLLAAILVGVAWLTFRNPLPETRPGPAADQLARQIEKSIDVAAWQKTGAVKWTFQGMHHLLWDRKRNFARVTWKGGHEVLVDLGQRRGVARVGGSVVEGEAGQKLVDKAWAIWANDSFWLNPLAKLFDDGVERSEGTLPDGKRVLLVRYGSGGVTPGDRYLWILAPDNRPEAMRMWVKIIPIGGVEMGWQGWTGLDTGAAVATRHPTRPLGIPLGKIDDLEAAETLDKLEPGPDPFAALAR
jgi:hypothetical protein